MLLTATRNPRVHGGGDRFHKIEIALTQDG
jgi:hypothetical protein